MGVFSYSTTRDILIQIVIVFVRSKEKILPTKRYFVEASPMRMLSPTTTICLHIRFNVFFHTYCPKLHLLSLILIVYTTNPFSNSLPTVAIWALYRANTSKKQRLLVLAIQYCLYFQKSEAKL